MISNFNGPLRTVQDLPLEISRGRIKGTVPFGAFGKLTASGAVTNNVIWPNGAFPFPDQVTGEDISFVSTNGADAVGGTGIARIEVHYLDLNLEPQRKDITLTGATAVTGQLSGVRFIQGMHVSSESGSVGSTLNAVGTITAFRAGAATTIFSIISPITSRASSSLRMVPAGKRGVIVGAVASSVSGTAAAGASVEAIATELDSHQYLDPFVFIPHASLGLQDSSEAYTFPVPLIFNAGTIIGLRVTLDKGSTVSGDWFGWLEEV